MQAVDNFTLERWRLLDATVVLAALAQHAKVDATYVPATSILSTRWHANVGGQDFELLLTGPKFWDSRSAKGGGGAVELVMHLERLGFKKATARLAGLGL